MGNVKNPSKVGYASPRVIPTGVAYPGNPVAGPPAAKSAGAFECIIDRADMHIRKVESINNRLITLRSRLFGAPPPSQDKPEEIAANAAVPALQYRQNQLEQDLDNLEIILADLEQL